PTVLADPGALGLAGRAGRAGGGPRPGRRRRWGGRAERRMVLSRAAPGRRSPLPEPGALPGFGQPLPVDAVPGAGAGRRVGRDPAGAGRPAARAAPAAGGPGLRRRAADRRAAARATQAGAAGRGPRRPDAPGDLPPPVARLAN